MKIKFTIFIFFIVSEISFAAEVNLYTSRHYDTDESLYDFFTKETGIEVNVISAKGNALIEKIKAEGSNTSADVFITVDAGNLWKLQKDGYFLSIESCEFGETITKPELIKLLSADSSSLGTSSSIFPERISSIDL